MYDNDSKKGPKIYVSNLDVSVPSFPFRPANTTSEDFLKNSVTSPMSLSSRRTPSALPSLSSTAWTLPKRPSKGNSF